MKWSFNVSKLWEKFLAVIDQTRAVFVPPYCLLRFTFCLLRVCVFVCLSVHVSPLACQSMKSPLEPPPPRDFLVCLYRACMLFVSVSMSVHEGGVCHPLHPRPWSSSVILESTPVRLRHTLSSYLRSTPLAPSTPSNSSYIIWKHAKQKRIFNSLWQKSHFGCAVY